MVHHYMEDDPKYERTEPTVQCVTIPHPDATDPPEPTPSPIVEPPPLPVKPPPVLKQDAHNYSLPDCCLLPEPPADPLVRDLAISLFAAFCLGVSVTTIIAVYSSRLKGKDA